ncbi:8-oxo-dGTP pyrophosphatase MutT (NUDIX family) [Tenggerimyces flavus]|nr:8-oxo-dGTP pyrophosphatase MutT (NUDIX family) [Tenggerimyces flavus]
MDGSRFPVPPAVAERARALAAGTATPAAVRRASTVLLLRDGPDGLEVYVIRRHTTMAFAAGMYAFPGGSLDKRDEAAGVSPWESAAARELFEETGVLLAGASPAEVVADTTGEDFEADRMALVGRAMSFAEFLAKRSLVLRSDLLAHAGHWVTPDAEERRFDTYFYFAALPTGQLTRDVSTEADRVAWIRPVDVEASVERGEMRMMPPTAVMLETLAELPTVAAAMEFARAHEVVRVAPTVLLDESGEARWSMGVESDSSKKLPGHRSCR